MENQNLYPFIMQIEILSGLEIKYKISNLKYYPRHFILCIGQTFTRKQMNLMKGKGHSICVQI